jgi:hypothetical protein
MSGLSEHAEQSLVVTQLRMAGILCASIPNDGKRSLVGAVKAKQRGLTAGAPDLVVFTPTPLAPKGVALEFKKRSGGHTDPGQERFLAELRTLGWVAEVVHGAPQALWLLRDLGYPVGTIGLREEACEAR